jgi:hypothetical protein
MTTSVMEGGTNKRFLATPAIQVGDGDEVYVDLATISGTSVGLPANTIYVRPSDGRLFRTV